METPLSTYDKAIEEIAGLSIQRPPQQDSERRPSQLSGSVPENLAPIFDAAARKYDVPVNVLLGLAEQESTFNPAAVGIPTKYGRAKGMLQYLDSTAAQLGINPYDPEQAVGAAAKQLRERLDRGETMEDAVKEHFAGPDRRQWGEKTSQYGADVMRRAGAFAKGYKMGEQADTGQSGNDQPSAQPQPTNPLDPNTPPPSPLNEAGINAWREGRQKQYQEMIDGLNKDEPGRYAVPTPEQLAAASGQQQDSQFDAGKLSEKNKHIADEAKAHEQPTGDARAGFLSDTGTLLSSGLNVAAQDVHELIGKIPWAGPYIAEAIQKGDKALFGKRSDEIYDESEKSVDKNLSPAMLAARAKEFVSTDKDGTWHMGSAWSDPRSYYSGLVESLPETLMTMGPTGMMAKGAYTGMIAKGATKAVAAKAAARTAAIVGGVSEGLLGGASSSRSVRDEINKMTPKELADSEVLKSLMSQGMSFEKARDQLANDSASKAFLVAGVANGVFGGMGDRALSKIITAPVEKGLVAGAKSMAKGMAKGAVGEGVFEEMPQSGLQQLSENWAMQDADPDRDLSKGVANAAVQGGVVGGIMGGGMGAGVPHVSGEVAPSETVPSTDAPVADGPLGRALQQAKVNPHTPENAPDVVMINGEPHIQIRGNEQAAVPASETDKTKPETDAFLGPVGSNATVTPLQPEIEPFKAEVLDYAGDDVIVRTPEGNRLQIPRTDLSLPDSTTVATNNDLTPAKAEPKPANSVPENVDTDTGEVSTQPTEQSYDDMQEGELRSRLKYLGQQAKATGGWSKKLVQERGKIERAINAKVAAPVEVAGGDEEPTSGQPKAQTEKLASNNPALNAEGSQKWFGSKLKAEAFLTKKGIADTHQIQKSDGGRWEIKAKDGSYLPSLHHDEVIAPGDVTKPELTGATNKVAGKIEGGPRRNRARKLLNAEIGSIVVPDDDVGHAKGGQSYQVDGIDKNGTVHLVNTETGGSTSLNLAEMERAHGRKVGYTQPVAKVEQAPVIDAAAHEAATSPTNDLQEPTEAQREAGNFKMGHIKVNGNDITVEIPAGGMRTGTDSSGKKWSQKLDNHYGYIRGTEANDGEQVDVYVKPGSTSSPSIFVVNQINPKTGKLDEHKVMLGFEDEASASEAYRANFPKGLGDKVWGGMSHLTALQFKEWLETGDMTTPLPDVHHRGSSDSKQQGNPPVPAQQHVSEPTIPASETQKNDSGQFAGNKLFTEDRVAAARARMKSKFGQLNSGIDPELLIDGMTIAGAYIESGVRNFSAYAKAMVDDFGNGVKPYLLSFWEGSRNYPGLDTTGMTSVDDSKKAYDALITPEDTNTDAVGEVAEKPVKRTRKSGSPSDASLTQDWGVDAIDGYGEGQRETGNDLKDAFLKEANTYLKTVAAQLEAAGFTVPALKNGKPGKATGVNESGTASSGEVHLVMDGPDGTGIYAHLGDTSLRGSVPTTTSGTAIMFRTNTPQDKYGTHSTNQWAPTDLSAADLAKMFVEHVARVRQHDASAAKTQNNRHAEENKTVEAPRSARNGSMEDMVNTFDSEVITREPEQLDERGEAALAGISTEPVQSLGKNAQTGGRTSASSGNDTSGYEPARGAGVHDRGRVADDAREVSVPKGGATDRRADEQSGRPDDAGSEPTDVIPGRAGSKPAGAVGSRRVERPASGAISQDRPVNFTIDGDQIGKGGQKVKYQSNIEAIRLLKALEAENRQATAEEQAVLAKYVGWGGLPQAFERSDGSSTKGWEKETAGLRQLLTAEEYEAAAMSSRNAHYTSPQIVNSVWAAMVRMGFKGGRVLEPSVGVGNFFGLMPHDIRTKSALQGCELDNITSGIAKQLYPGAKIAHMGFQDFVIPDGHFDIAIGNPPFGAEKLYDGKRKDLSGFNIHSYFFAKTLDGLKPGGVMGMVVTNRMLDSASDKARQYMAGKADLLAAIRLPNDAFAANAGTEVTTDLIFLRRRAEGDTPNGIAWGETVEYTDKDGNKVPLNEYFAAHPDMMLGDFGAYGSMYRGGDSALVAREGQDTGAELVKAIASLPKNIMTTGSEARPETPATVRAENVKVGSAYIDGDTIHIRGEDTLGEQASSELKLPSEKAKERVMGMIGLRDALAKVRALQLSEVATPEAIETSRAKLNKLYDAFVQSSGPVNLDANKRLFRDDPTWPQVSALEDDFDRGVSPAIAKKTGETARAPSAKKSAIFSKRTQSPYKAPHSANSAKDALVTTLAETGRVDVEMMSRLYKKSPETILKELGDLVYEDPSRGYVTSDEYLSGNVREKLAAARVHAKSDPAYQRNVEALESVQPKDVEAVDISVKPGASWLPSESMGRFADHITDGSKNQAIYNPVTAKWSFNNVEASAASTQRFSTSRVGMKQVLEAAAAQTTIQVYDTARDGSRVLNETETTLANDKVNAVKEEFGRWIWSDDARRESLTRMYNDTFNTNVERQYDGSHLTFPGKVGDDIIQLRPHQSNAVWRIVQSNTTLTDHTVGAGKTFTLIAAAMELRRMGLAKKPMFAVPNHLVGQWASDFIKLYPGANILAATKKDFDKENRQRLFARIATGDWDAVIVAHSSFGKVEVEPEAQAEFIRSQIADLTYSENMMKEAEGGKSRNVKDIAKRKAMLEEKLKRLLDVEGKDASLYWGELGVDALFVDEAHEFKNLGFSSSMNRVAGLGNQQGSQKAQDMFMKVQEVLKATGGRNIVFATGTPISNSMAEMYTMQRYLDYANLKAQGLSHFDAWARNFGEVVTDWELSPSGTYKMNSRFAKFVNMPELMQRYTTVADVINRDDINRQLAVQGKKLPVPKVKGGKPQNIVVPRSADQAEYIGEPTVNDDGTESYPEHSLIYRAEHLPRKAEKGSDNMLKIMSDARKAALDMRLIDPDYPDNPNSKVNVAANNIKATYDMTATDRGGQLVFIDLSTPKAAKGAEAKRVRDLVTRAENGDEDAITQLDKISPDELSALDSEFSVYDDLKQKLIGRGIPENEIAFIHDANTELQKEELFAKVRSGRVRVLLGSTAKMGAGMNVQDRLVALHHLDAPWRPSDLEQREGRIIRQGNKLYEADPENFEVEINRYATKQTLDSRMWQTIEGKANFIEQVRKGNSSVREIEDIAGEAANAAEMKAASSGNPLILEEMSLRQQIRKLETERTGHDREQFRLRDAVRTAERKQETATSRLKELEHDAKIEQPKEFQMTVGDQTADKRKDAGEDIIKVAKHLGNSGQSDREIGSYGGFSMHLEKIPEKDHQFVISLVGEGSYDVPFTTDADPVGLAMRITNSVKDLGGAAEQMEAARDLAQADIPKLQDQVKSWSKQGELSKAKEAHAAVVEQLKPKKKADTEEAAKSEEPADQTKYSLQGESAADLSAQLKEQYPGLKLGLTGSGTNATLQRIELPKADRNNGTGTKVMAQIAAWADENDVTIALSPTGDFGGNKARLKDFYKAAGFVENKGIDRDFEVSETMYRLPKKPAGHKYSVQEVKASVQRGEMGKVLKKLIESGDIVISDHPPAGAPKQAAAWTTPDGNIHLLASKLNNGNVQSLLLHEMFHAKGRNFMGKKRWNNLSQRLDGFIKGAEKRAAAGQPPKTEWDKAYARVAQAEKWGQKLSPELKREELAAYAVENFENMPAGIKRWVQSVIGAVKEFLAFRFGKQLGEVTPAQLHAMTSRAVRSSMKNGSRDQQGGEHQNFPDPVESPAFKRWFGDSKVLTASGNPKVVYHGTSDDITAFDPSFRGSNTMDEDARLGFYFTDNEAVAEEYANESAKTGGNIIPVYLSAQNPLVVDHKGNGYDPKAFLQYIEKAKGGGHDGVIIKNANDDFKNKLSGTTYVVFEPEQIKSAIGNTGAFDSSTPDIRYSTSSQKIASDEQLNDHLKKTVWDKIKNLSGDALTQVMPKLLATVPLRPLIKELGKNNIALQEFMKLKQKMDARRGDWHATTDKVSQEWRKYAKGNVKENVKLMDLMHETTREQVDPSKEFESILTPLDEKLLKEDKDTPLHKAALEKAARDSKREKAYAGLQAEYDALSPAAKKVYNDVRNTYQAITDEYERILIGNMEKALNIKVKQAERQHERDMKVIKDEGLKGEELNEAIKAADLRLKTAKTLNKWNRAARITQMRQNFEMNRLQGPYFPLARFGKYFATVRDKEGKVQGFSKFEKANAQRKFADELRRDPRYTVETGVLDDTHSISKQIDPNFVADIEDIVGDLNGGDRIKDEIWQRYLESMPDMSVRKNRIHRKGTEGFDKDAVRAFAYHMFHGSHQLSKLEFAMDMGEAVDAARKEAADDREDPNRATHLVNEVALRNEFIMNPTGGAIAHAISQAGFLYHLAVTPAAALVNLSQTVLLGAPIMASYMAKKNPLTAMAMVSKQLIRATADFTRGKGAIENSKGLKPDEKKAMEAGYTTGTIDRTQSHDLAGVAESGISYNATRQKVMKGFGWAFHHAERFNREVTFMASYRLARQNGESYSQAVDTANDLTWKIHFDYQNTSRPRVMQNDTAKVLLMFRNYSANMLFRLARDVYKSINPKNKAERKEALTQFAGITGMMMIHAGARGVWFYGIAMAIASLFMEPGDDPEEEMKKAMMDAIGPTATGIALNGLPGHALGWDISGRIGMPDLWFRSPDKELEGEDAYNYWMSQALGAAPSMVANAFKGLSMVAKGNVYRGVETAAPKAIKDQMRAYRFASEGAETMKGDDILPEMTPWEIASQSLGFTPAALSERYKQNSANMNKQTAILDERGSLLSRYNKADEAGDEAELDKIDIQIEAYSDKYPEQAISGKTISRSMKTREKNSERNVGGMNYNEKLKDRLLDEQSRSIYR